MYNERECQAKVGGLVVLIFWPNLRLAVLIEVVLIEKKRVTLESNPYESCTYLSQKKSPPLHYFSVKKS